MEQKRTVSRTQRDRPAVFTERHAIRFLGTRYCSAWKWVISNNRLTVYATLIDVVSNNSTSAASWYSSNWSGVTFGNNDSQMAVQRSFYMRGYNSSGNNSTYNNAHDTNGYLQSATETGTGTCWHLQYYTGVAAVYRVHTGMPPCEVSFMEIVSFTCSNVLFNLKR